MRLRTWVGLANDTRPPIRSASDVHGYRLDHAITVTLTPEFARSRVGAVSITNAATKHDVRGDLPPDTPSITLTTPVSATTTSTYKIRVAEVTPTCRRRRARLRHRARVGVDGAPIHSRTRTPRTAVYRQPLAGDVTAATTRLWNPDLVAWTNPADADLSKILVLRRQARRRRHTPVEGTTY